MPDLLSLPRAALHPVVAGSNSLRARVLESIGANVVRAASHVRGERVIHAKGITLRARLIVPGGAALGVPLFDEPGTWQALVRFSRGAGLPDSLPDVLGVAVRVLDAHGPGRHQDLLASSSRLLPLARHLPVPAYDLLHAQYTSITPYRLGEHDWLLWVLPEGGAPVMRSLEDLRGRADGSRVRIAVSTAHGMPHEVAELELGNTAPDGREIRFSPDVTGGGIRPVGWLQDLRRRAYRASHVGPDA